VRKIGGIETFKDSYSVGEAMPQKRYHSLVIPESLYLQLKHYVNHSNGRYISVAEAVRKALWNALKSNEAHE
jgi:Arc/MetJ-type ribon-helix-helix transcriptional regulator